MSNVSRRSLSNWFYARLLQIGRYSASASHMIVMCVVEKKVKKPALKVNDCSFVLNLIKKQQNNLDCNKCVQNFLEEKL